MKTNSKLSIAGALALLAAVAATQAGTTVYDNLSTGAAGGYSQANANNPIFGDSLTLSAGGQLSFLGLTLFNSDAGGNTGSILTGTMLVRFYDNTTPYSGGSLNNPLLGSATVTWDFTGMGGLAAGYYETESFDLTSEGIVLPMNILITQQFTETSGTSTRNGVVLFSDPTTGSSPNSVYINSTSIAEGLYYFSGNPSQFGYHIEVIPEPSCLALAGLAGAVLLFRRRR